MEYKYYRELKHNYLVFEDKSIEGESRYQYKIVESGRVKALLPCAERNINSGRYLYYEINSMQTLKDRFAVNGMDLSQLRKLLCTVKELLEELSEFLLGQDGLVFNAKSIYTDLSTGEFKFIYCPFYDEQKSFSEFAMELLELVDENDNEATELVYKLCESCSTYGDFIYDALESALSDQDVPQEKEEKPLRGSYEEFCDMDDHEDDEDLYDERKEQNSGLKKAEAKLSGKVQLLFSLMFACVLGAMVYVRMNFILSSQENILSILVMLVSALTGTVAFVGGLKAMKGKTPQESKEHRKTESFDEDEMFADEADGVDYGDDSDGYDYDRETDFGYKAPVKVTGSFTRQQTECEETTVLDQDENRDMALFSRNLDKTVRIALDRLPLTVGKMEGCVDKVLKDSSISRIHCRFIREGERVAVLDLGSTNGTYRNGLRLSPQEKIYIEEGDEIRLGRVCFDCR
jgi:hypothetical protein